MPAPQGLPFSPETAKKTLLDRAWRLRNLYTIKPKGQPKMVFSPNWAQVELDAELSRRGALRMGALKVRQLGISTSEVIDSLDSALFEPGGNMRCGVIDISLERAKDKVAMARYAYDQLDAVDHPLRELGQWIKAQRPLVKDSTTEIAWSNGSFYAGSTSFVGRTVDRLHVSDAGKIAFEDPERSREILESFEAVPESTGRIMCEGTHSGGKAGWFYDLCQGALGNAGKDLLPVEFAFFFLSWWKHPEYDFDPAAVGSRVPGKEAVDYFRELEERHGIVVSQTRQLWWEAKRASLKDDIFSQYPSHPGEAWNAPVDGAIYGDIITRLRIDGRVAEFVHHRDLPLFTFWDIGVRDATSVWLVQVSGTDIFVVDYHEDTGESASHYADVMRNWERSYGRTVACHFLPHDGSRRDWGSGMTPIESLKKAGLGQVELVERTPKVWDSINRLRDLMPRCIFHSRTDEPIIVDNQKGPSGLNRLETYRKKVTASGGTERAQPVHDENSHAADALRTFADAEARGQLSRYRFSAGGSSTKSKLRVKMSRDARRAETVTR